MSLAICIERVNEVLLGDGWHNCALRNGESSFQVDDYEYLEKDNRPRLLGGQDKLIPAKGATWNEGKDEETTIRIFCPLTSILAVKEYAKTITAVSKKK